MDFWPWPETFGAAAFWPLTRKQSTDETEKQSNCLNSPTATFVDWKFFQEKNKNNIFEPKVVFNEGCTKRFSPNLLLLVDGKNRVFLSPTLRCWAVQPRGFPLSPSPPHSSLTTVWSCSNSSDTYWPDNWRPKFLKEKWWFLINLRLYCVLTIILNDKLYFCLAIAYETNHFIL